VGDFFGRHPSLEGNFSKLCGAGFRAAFCRPFLFDVNFQIVNRATILSGAVCMNSPPKEGNFF
jgi:hypothetical protein